MTAISRILLLSALAATSVHGFAPSLSATTSRQSQQQQMFDPAHAVGDFYQNEPYLAAFLTCSVKGSAADCMAQKQQSSTKFDPMRNLAFILYGGLYQGIGQSFVFSHVYPHLFGTDHTITTVASQVLTDLFLVGPFFFLPTAYTIKASLASASPLDLSTNIKTGVDNYLGDIFGKDKLLLKYWSLWIPVQSLTFGVVPEHLRVPFVAMVSFFWIMLLSSVSSSRTTEEQAASTTPVSPATVTPAITLPLLSPQPLPLYSMAKQTAFVPPSAWPEKQLVSM